MRIKEIQIKNFKRFDNLIIKGTEQSKLVALVGPNGSGKSSILEACNTWQKSKKWSIIDTTYHNKYLNIGHRIDIFFNQDLPHDYNYQKLMHFRSAHRNEADFTIEQFSRMNKPYEDLKLKKIIDNDTSVSDNFKRLVGTTISDVYDEKNSKMQLEDLRERLIGKIRKSMINIFGDLILEGISNPFENGSFYFKKGKVEKFHYKNLSSGEKAAFDLLLDLVLKIEYFEDGIIFIDEPETHMHTSLQSKLIEEIYNIIPDNNQLWITTHSLGILQKIKELIACENQDISIIDFSEQNFDEEIVLEPCNIDNIIWEKFLSFTIGNLSNFIAPEIIIFCEGSLCGEKRKNFDAEIYNNIFNKKYPKVTFIAGGNCEDLKKDDNQSVKLLEYILPKTKIIKLIDRDTHADEEVKELNNRNIIVLNKTNLETYLLDDEILELFCQKNFSDYSKVFEQIKQTKQKDIYDLKKVRGEIFNALKEQLKLESKNYNIGSNADSFLKSTLCKYITEDTQIYKELENIIFGVNND
ncbi:AAA family ATPase [Campylobacter lari]|nr:ATP-binding cassette domain-containing protein [Campylobacter lari]EAK0945319.1 ATP-binding cassette domain-containing protein [Campylobacter lari]EAK0949096.1 ATP-binding cassette domain-containing protein [Campylobacter lari]EAK1241049.1 ATP-binding cassette domain-containing protein [Campylobacter lari]